jgi:class 3 adenylate cyclase
VMGYKGEEGEKRDYRKECMAMVEMSFRMVDVIYNVNARDGIDLNMRIGLHTGEVIAGITGTKVVRYDIYGPDAMLANKMESGGESGKINVSDVTRRIMEEMETTGRYTYEDNKEISAKAVNGTHMSYFVIQN